MNRVEMKQLFYQGNKVGEVKAVKEKILQWAAQYEHCTFLDHNDYADYPHQEKEGLLACGSDDSYTLLKEKQYQDQKDLQGFQDWLDAKKDWTFGILS